ncbi:phosphatase PAP2 family protein [Salinigranum halophilum]|uniref:phosphatase PAP2 family protein n=1 Tax=Salinigranum halophilum TaxID=2565931 RepID=UPI0010A89517|nr:phosphatase PAP2 family protein [Salinigranum halophilum]
MRGLGELAVVSEFPPVVVELFGLLTTLGDPWPLLGGLALLYAVSDRLGLDRRRVGFVFATAFVALGVTLALKSAFALPRPPGALEDGYGFPSGHALGATVVWGTAALALDTGRRRVRLALAALVVPIVAASRVVIGVHYLVDVVVGTVVGIALVGAVLAATWRDRTEPPSHAAVDRVFAAAAVTALVALFLSGSVNTLLTVGATLGGWVGWRAVEPTVEPVGRSLPPRGTAVTVVGLPVVLGGLLSVGAAAEAAAISDLLTMGLAGGCVGLLFVLPRVAGRLVE